MNVSAQTVRRMLRENNMHGRRPRKKPLLQSRHKTAKLSFANDHVMKPVEFWDKILGSDETKINLFGSDGQQYVQRHPHEKCLIPTVNHGRDSLMACGYMSSKAAGNQFFNKIIMKPGEYCVNISFRVFVSLA